jgi:hypothetical protein
MALMGWLIDSDPAIRWQVMRDLTGEPDQREPLRRNAGARSWLAPHVSGSTAPR